MERIVYDLATFDVEYQVEVSNGVVHLRQVMLAGSAKNPLNVTVPEFSVSNVYVGQAGFKLQDLVNGMIFPRKRGDEPASAGSYSGGAGDRLISLSMKNTTMRDILDALLTRSGYIMWLVVFGPHQPDSGYWKTTPPWRKTKELQQPDIDFVTRYHDPTTNRYRRLGSRNPKLIKAVPTSLSLHRSCRVFFAKKPSHFRHIGMLQSARAYVAKVTCWYGSPLW